MIQSACQTLLHSLSVALLLGAFGEQLDGDPDDHRAADKLDEGHVQQLRHQEGADHPDDDCAAGTQDDPHLAVLALQVLDRHGDDHGVVAGQHQIDEHDAHHRHEEFPRKRNLPQPTQIDHVASLSGFAAANKKTFTRGMRFML